VQQFDELFHFHINKFQTFMDVDMWNKDTSGRLGTRFQDMTQAELEQ
jgi:hypothetical protein